MVQRWIGCRSLVLATAVVSSALALTACGGGGSDPLATSAGKPAASDTIVVGSANFPENVTAALNAVSAKLTTPVLAGLDKQVQSDKKDPETVANSFLSSNGLS